MYCTPPNIDDQARSGRATAGNSMPPKLAFVFSSRESLWAGLWSRLRGISPRVSDSLDRSDAEVRRHLGWSLHDQLGRHATDELLLAAEHLIEPALTASQIALADAWSEYGIEPDAVVGRSAGEFAAGYARGALSHAGAIELACRVSTMIQGGHGAGHVVRVELPAADLEALRQASAVEFFFTADSRSGGAFVACRPEVLDAFIAMMEARSVACRVEPISVAAHSPLMDTFAEQFLAPLSSGAPAAHSVRCGYSAITADLAPAHQNLRFFWDAIRQPVRIQPTLRRMIDDGIEVFVEVGGRSSFASMVADAARPGGRRVHSVSSVRRDESRVAVMHDSRCYLASLGFRPQSHGMSPGVPPSAIVAPLTAPSANRLHAATAAGLAALSSRQLPDGEFQTWLGHEPCLVDGTFDSSVFVTALVCIALQQVGPDASPLIARAVAFIEREREWGGLWRYYSSKNFKHLRVPPDLDDTCVASLALQLRGRGSPANRATILSNRDATGRFGTWIIRRPTTPTRVRLVRWVGELVARRKTPPAPPDVRGNPRFAEPRDQVAVDEIDPVVNANAVAYLGDGHETAAATAYLRSLASQGLTASSHYYSNPLALACAMSRAIDAGVTSLADTSPRVIEAVRRHLDVGESALTPLTAGLGVAAHCTLAPPDAVIARAVHFLLESQQADGSWRREVFYNGAKEFWGSEELTTAMALEALARYRTQVFRSDGHGQT
jgi:malonyl CoA-acyl carrier protein transacylase